MFFSSLDEVSPIWVYFGEAYKVRARIEVMNYFSAHADRSDLLEFTTHIKGLKRVFLVHGDSDRSMALKTAMESNEIPHVLVPKWGETYDLSVKNISTDMEPSTRIACEGKLIYDRTGKDAPADKNLLKSVEIPQEDEKEKIK